MSQKQIGYYPYVLQVIPGENRSLYVYFDDGTVRLYNIKDQIEFESVFAPLKDDAFFREHLTVINGAVAWDVTGDRDEYKCIDLDPIVIYRTAKIVPDPLEKEKV